MTTLARPSCTSCRRPPRQLQFNLALNSANHHDVGTTDPRPCEAGYRLCGRDTGIGTRLDPLSSDSVVAGQAPSEQGPDGRRDGRSQAFDEPL